MDFSYLEYILEDPVLSLNRHDLGKIGMFNLFKVKTQPSLTSGIAPGIMAVAAWCKYHGCDFNTADKKVDTKPS